MIVGHAVSNSNTKNDDMLFTTNVIPAMPRTIAQRRRICRTKRHTFCMILANSLMCMASLFLSYSATHGILTTHSLGITASCFV